MTKQDEEAYLEYENKRSELKSQIQHLDIEWAHKVFTLENAEKKCQRYADKNQIHALWHEKGEVIIVYFKNPTPSGEEPEICLLGYHIDSFNGIDPSKLAHWTAFIEMEFPLSQLEEFIKIIKKK